VFVLNFVSLLRNTPLNLSRSRKTWEDVGATLSTNDVFQDRPFSRINDAKRKEERTERRIITTLKFEHFTTRYYNTYNGQERSRVSSLGRPKRLLLLSSAKYPDWIGGSLLQLFN
jgi:ABC-type molybdate transport system ATPase subunit